MKMKQTVFWIITLALTLVGCSKEKETPPTPKSGIEMVAIGPINFGGLLVGETRDAAIRVYNYGPGDLNTSNLIYSLTHNDPADPAVLPEDVDKIVLVTPFKIQSVSAPCSSGTLPAGRNCVIAVRFSPVLPGIYTHDLRLCINPGNASTCSSITTNGRGMVGGVMSISETHWDVGQTYAGIETRKSFTLTNLGDYTIPAPTLTLIPGVTVGLNTCGSFIATQRTCVIELVAKKTVMGYTNENVIFNAGTGGTISVNVENTIIPGEASGTIGFIDPPASIVADGVGEYTVTSQPIRDQYGNIVVDGTSVRITSGNATVITPSPQTTVNGQVTFTFRAPTTKGFATISLLSGDANGFLRSVATAGPPSGVLEVQTYPASVTANGVTQVLFKLLPVKDQFGNVVEDGTPIFFSVQGGGTLSTPSNFTILGSAQVALTAASQVGTAIVQFRASPIYDENENIIDWGASGNYQITYTPGIPAGVIPITANNPAIYAIEDQVYENQGIPVYSTVTIGPVRDLTGNIVATNTPININVVGGRNVTFQNPTYPITGHTDDNGNITMIMAGNGVRGYINITAQGQGGSTAYGAYNLWAFTESRYLPTNNILDNRFTLFETVAPAASLPDLLTTKWASFGANDLAALSANDGVTFTVMGRNSSTINTFLSNMPYFQSPCWFARDKKLQAGPCPVDQYKSNKGSLAYDAIGSDGLLVDVNGPGHRPLLTLKSPYLYSSPDEVTAADNIPQGSYGTGTHDPLTRGGWSSHWGSPVLGAAGFLPYDNTYVYFGGAFIYDGTSNFCPRIQFPGFCSDPLFTSLATCNAAGGGRYWTTAIDACNARSSSCQWDNANQVCRFKNTLFGYSSDWGSLYFNMDRINQTVTSTFQYGAMDSDQVGEYPPEAALASTASNGNDLLYTFGGYNLSGQNARKDLYVMNANNKKWTMIYADPDPNERGDNGVPSPRYQAGLVYVKDNDSVYLAGGRRRYDCSEFITKSACLQSAACSWDDASGIEDEFGPFDSSYYSSNPIYTHVPLMDNIRGEYCKPVSQSVCNDIIADLRPYNSGNTALAQSECNRRLGCQWNAPTLSCSLRNGTDTSGGGWLTATDFWKLDLSPLTDSDPNTNPTWKKLCDSQEPYIGNNQSQPNPAYRSCGFPNGICSNIAYTTQTACQSAGASWNTNLYPDLGSNAVLQAATNPYGSTITERHTNVVWNPLKGKMYFAWEGINNLLAYDPYTDAFSSPTGSLSGLANSYQLIFSPYTGKTFAYKRGSISGNNSFVRSVEYEPNERRYIRAEIALGNGTKEFATTVKPIIRASGKITGATTASGVTAYVYNYSSNQWILVGTNTFTTQSSDITGFANNEISQEFLNQAARDLVSDEGKVNILVVPNGNPANGSTQELNIESIAIEGRF